MMYDTPRRHQEFDALLELKKTGPLPHQLEERYQKLRREQLIRAGLKASQYPPPSTSSLEPADMTVVDWLQDKWLSANEAVRESLRILAAKLSIDVPLTRTRPIPVQDSKSGDKDSSPEERSESARHTSQHGNPASSDELAGLGLDPQFRRRGTPEWHDDDADGWTPSESLHDALRDALDPEDRGWS